MTLKDLTPGMSAVIEKVGGKGALRQHFLDMGVIPGEEITLIKFAPMGDPMELMIHGYELTLRLADAEQIDISNVHKKEPKAPVPQEKKETKPKEHQHPRIGEVYSGHDYAEEHAKGHVKTTKEMNYRCNQIANERINKFS